MRLQGNLKLKKFLIWRIKNIPNKQFIHIVSIVVGILSGVLAMVMKNTTYFFQALITQVNTAYQSLFYFIFPIIGIILTLGIIHFIIKKPVSFMTCGLNRSIDNIFEIAVGNTKALITPAIVNISFIVAK